MAAPMHRDTAREELVNSSRNIKRKSAALCKCLPRGFCFVVVVAVVLYWLTEQSSRPRRVALTAWLIKSKVHQSSTEDTIWKESEM